MASHVVSEGQILAGKYRVEKVIGEGGMGVVVAARHLQLDEFVAIKFLLPEVAQNPEAVERFAREARASIKIKSEHVVRVMDVGTMEGGIPYMVMEYLQGGDLSALLQVRKGPLGIHEAIEYLLQGCEALADAHVLGIVHRDLKPANLFLSQRSDGTPCIKVLDFGISKVTGTSSSGMQMTKTSAVMGSPLYMSPEQMVSSRDVDVRSDIWALGAILYETLTGVPPFTGDTLPQVCALILQNDPVPLRMHRPDIPEGLDRIVLRCLQKKREARFQNVAELAVALLEYGPKQARSSVERITRVLTASGLSNSALALPPSSTAPPVAGGQTAGAWTQTASGKRSSNKSLIVAAIVAVLLVGAGASILAVRALRSGPDSSATVLSGVSSSVAPVPSAESSVPATSTATASAPVASQVPIAASGTASTPVAPPSKTSTAKVPPTTGTATSKKSGTPGKGLDLFNDNK
ncbi:MAG: protein kinase [Deltaproteobacteria bacterium]|nr:protein kinase [Deltaproteobacteria bacterium]